MLKDSIGLPRGYFSCEPFLHYKRGEGIHHIAFAVDNMDSEIERLKNEGFELINDEAKDGADGKMIAFLHPSSTNKVLTEICADE
jgi:methylmalonyl-CoA/ethylmalonyl-CoA epimerase